MFNECNTSMHCVDSHVILRKSSSVNSTWTILLLFKEYVG
jgi:hypothetical protein